MDYLKIHDWDQWQTYRKDREQPPWIKVHRRLLRDVKWSLLTDAERGQLVGLWLVAADNNGQIPAIPELLQKWCSMSGKLNLERFIELGFIDSCSCQDDANMTPTRRQDDAKVTPQNRIDKNKISTDTDTLTLPEWFQEKDWQLFLSHRKALKAPISKGSYSSFIAKFDSWRAAGYDPHTVIDTMVEKGWRSFKPEWMEKKDGKQESSSPVRRGLARFLASEDE